SHGAWENVILHRPTISIGSSHRRLLQMHGRLCSLGHKKLAPSPLPLSPGGEGFCPVAPSNSCKQGLVFPWRRSSRTSAFLTRASPPTTSRGRPASHRDSSSRPQESPKRPQAPPRNPTATHLRFIHDRGA